MNKNQYNILLGLILLVFGIIMFINYLGIVNINLFFNGWWTLFIIIPSFLGLFKKGNKAGNILLLIFGIMLLLDQQEIIPSYLVWNLTFASALIIFGIYIIVSGFKSKKNSTSFVNTIDQKNDNENYISIFSSQKSEYKGSCFNGANMLAIFGSVTLDLRNCNIDKNAVVYATSIFGTCNLLMKDGINIKTSGFNIFGDISNKVGQINDKEFPIIYVNGVSLFGDIKIKS